MLFNFCSVVPYLLFHGMSKVGSYIYIQPLDHMNTVESFNLATATLFVKLFQLSTELAPPLRGVGLADK